MSINETINQLKTKHFSSKEEAQQFLDQWRPNVQEALIAAVYAGRNHLHESELRTDEPVSLKATDHIPQEEYAEILYGKRNSIGQYLNKLQECATKSNADLNELLSK
jgi:hypothetical protein